MPWTDKAFGCFSGLGCLTLLIVPSAFILFVRPIWTLTIFVNFLPVQILTSCLLAFSVFGILSFAYSLLSKERRQESFGILKTTIAASTVTAMLLYLMWVAIGAKKHDLTVVLPEFQGTTSTNEWDLEEGVYLFEIENAIFGQSHWGIWMPGLGGFELSGRENTLTSGLDFSNPYWRELQEEPVGDVKFSDRIDVKIEKLIEVFNDVRGVDQLFWDANNNCKTQSLLLLAVASGDEPSEIRDQYCSNLDCNFTLTWNRQLIDKESAQPAQWHTRRFGAMFNILFVQPVVIGFLYLLFRSFRGGKQSHSR